MIGQLLPLATVRYRVGYGHFEEAVDVSYMLVIQWNSDAFTDFDSMIRTEDALCQGLSEPHEVDGHDSGTGQTNIFVATDAPQSALPEIKTILQAEGRWDGVRIAFRPGYGDGYSVLWPESLREFQVT